MQRNVPLVDQVCEQIIAQIEDLTIGGDGEPLPSEAALAKAFSVSRATVSNALDRLERAGVVMRRHGVGTFVTRTVSNNPATVRGRFDQTSSFSEFIRCSGRAANCRVLQTTITPAARLAERLGINSSADVVTVEKLFYASSTPIIHCVNVVPLSLLGSSFVSNVRSLYEQAESTYQFLETCAGRQVHHQESEVWAALAGDRLASLLGCPSGGPLLRVEEVGYSAELVPLFYGLNHLRGELVSLRQTRVPIMHVLDAPSDSQA